MAARTDLSKYNNSEYNITVSVWAMKAGERHRLATWDATKQVHSQDYVTYVPVSLGLGHFVLTANREMLDLQLPTFAEYANFTVTIETDSVFPIGT